MAQYGKFLPQYAWNSNNPPGVVVQGYVTSGLIEENMSWWDSNFPNQRRIYCIQTGDNDYVDELSVAEQVAQYPASVTIIGSSLEEVKPWVDRQAPMNFAR